MFSMTKRIILFGPLPPPYGGVAIYVKSLVEHLRHPQIRVWTYGGAKPEDCSIRFIAHRKLGTVAALLNEARAARILDVSHFHLEYPNPLLLTAWLILKRRLRFEWYKNILDGSLPARYPQFGKLQRWLFHRGINAVDKFVVVSEELRRWLQEEMGVHQPVTVIPCLLPNPPGDETALAPATENTLQSYLLREKRVCSIGVFYPAYGFIHVAEAVEELRKRTGKDIGVLLLDGGFVRDDSYRDAVLRDRDWITVLEKVSHPEIFQILKRSDVFVRATAEEGYGISRVEAIWCGLPVVATRAGETRGMLLYDFGEVKQLVDQLQAVLLFPVLEDTNPWAGRYRKEAADNLRAITEVLGIEPN
jgi:glycosyltransferase involved in cell wall biosynthesis